MLTKFQKARTLRSTFPSISIPSIRRLHRALVRLRLADGRKLYLPFPYMYFESYQHCRTREIRTIIRGLEGINLAAADIVEVAPAYDTNAELTTMVSAKLRGVLCLHWWIILINCVIILRLPQTSSTRS